MARRIRRPDGATVFRGGAVYTMDPSRPWGTAVAVRGVEIVAVGSDAETIAAGGPDAEIIDLDGHCWHP